MITLYTGNFHGTVSQGLVRDIRVRWALEEADLAYQTSFVSRTEMASADYRHFQPFAKIPALAEGNVVLFESAAILLYLGEKSEALMPNDRGGKARTTAWVLAGAATVEPAIEHLCHIDLFPSHPEAEQIMRPDAERVVRTRLEAVADALADKPYLQGQFSVADIVMRSAFSLLRHTDIIAGYPTLAAYMRRCEARPAYQRALADHNAAYTAAA